MQLDAQAVPQPLPRMLVGLPAGDHPAAGLTSLVESARHAEEVGIDGVILAEHVVVGNRTDAYPWGTFPFPPAAPWPDPLTVLAAISSVTTGLLLSTGVLIAALRRPAVLAKSVATLDRLSLGRVVLGVGAGWQEEEFRASGVDFAQRGQALTETIAACRALWAPGTTPAVADGPPDSHVWCEPKPARNGGPTVLFAGTLTGRNIHRITTLGDGWIPIMGETIDGIAAGVTRLRDELTSVGRSPDDLVVRAPLPIVKNASGHPDIGRTIRRADELLEAGANELWTYLGLYTDRLDGISDVLEQAGDALADTPIGPGAIRFGQVGTEQSPISRSKTSTAN